MRRVAKWFVPMAAFVFTALSSAAALAIGLAALGGGLGQGRAAASALDGIARNPQASGKIFVPMIVALALIESLVIYGLLIAFNLAGKL
jgi:F-type H+-transporting ATPase subunit c